MSEMEKQTANHMCSALQLMFCECDIRQTFPGIPSSSLDLECRFTYKHATYPSNLLKHHLCFNYLEAVQHFREPDLRIENCLN